MFANQVSVSTFESAFSSVLDSLRKLSDGTPGDLEPFITVFAAVKEAFNWEALTYCLGQYISAELDCETPGKRGLGRLTTDTPRLGGYFRRRMAALDRAQLDLLYHLIEKLIITGYLSIVIWVEEEPQKHRMIAGVELYEKWIPGIYHSLQPLPKEVTSAFTAFCTSSFEELKQFLRSHGMTGGGLFSADKTEKILSHYAFAGAALRFSELELSAPTQ